MDEVEVVHISPVISNAETLFNEVVELVEVEQRENLAALVPYWDADVSGRAVDYSVREGEAALVVKVFADVPLQDVVLDAGEIVVDVGL